mmetsp:Transcript_109133/g.315302  ORF Transcript_109133/g.315302 Transcript_109133/m.315302 type:complete len:381 (-) Transcript_109133:92-1234(-)
MASTLSAPRAAGRRLLVVASLALAATATQRACEGNDAVCQALNAERDDIQGLGLLQVAKDGSQERRQMQIPGFGDIISSAGDALNNAVDAAKSQAAAIGDNLTQQVEQIAQTVQQEAQGMASGATTSAAVIAAQTLNKTFQYLGDEAGVLTKACFDAKAEALARVEGANASVNDVLAAFEDEATRTVNRVLPVWSNFTAAVLTAGNIASSALSGVGQSELAQHLTTQLNKSVTQADAYARTLQNLTQVVEGLKSEQMDKVMARLRRVNETLDRSMDEATGFAGNIMNAFDEFTDKAAAQLSSALPGANKTIISRAFESVDETARHAVRSAMDGPQTLVTGVGSATVVVERTLPEEVRSAAVATIPTLLAVAAAVATAFVA